MGTDRTGSSGATAVPLRPTAQDWAACRATSRSHGKSFYLASRALPLQRRQAIQAAYAYCRMADDIVDRAAGESQETVHQALESWQSQLQAPEHPVAIAFSYARATYRIPDQPIHDLLRGLRQDLTVGRYETWHDLHEYCYLVAGTVGLIVAPILGCRDSSALQHAANLGIAMQLTNILRDVSEDAAMGRVYLPADELAHFGMTPESILSGQPGPGFPSLMQFQIARARALYASAFGGVGSLCPSGRLATLAAAQLYSGILDEIERLEYNVFSQRAVTSRSTKSRHIALALRHFALLAIPEPARGFWPRRRAEFESLPSATGEPVALSLASSSRNRR